MQQPISENRIEMYDITKNFNGKVLANDHASLILKRGEILGLLGENGSGKTTLMNILAGIYYPDEGRIIVDGKEVIIRSPKNAFDLGIGMIHQHFKLVDVLTAAENIVLGMDDKGRLDLNVIKEKVYALINEYGFEIDLDEKIYNMSVSQKQTVEIVKQLYRGADMLILDEPTAVLTPQETEKLFYILRNMRNAGHSIIIITHKLSEVLSLTDRVTIMRKGGYVGTVNTCDATEMSLTEMMMGGSVDLSIERPDPVNPIMKLKLTDVTVVNKEGQEKLSHVSLEANTGEILGIAGISGSGQKELLESIVGLQRPVTGTIQYRNRKGHIKELTKMSPERIREIGIRLAFVPEDRLGMGLVASMGMTDNMMLRSYKAGGAVFKHRKQPRKLAEQIKNRLRVATPDIEWPVGRLSGGNVQKVLVGREIATSPQVLMVAYPVRGLDVNSSSTIYQLLNEQKMKGSCVICVGEDLDVLLALCDRIAVLCDGKLTGVVDARVTTKEQLGLLMTSGKEEA